MAISILSSSAGAVAPIPEEMAQAREWTAAKFEGVAPEASKTSGLLVLANYMKIQQNSRDGNPLKIANTTYNKGIFCHAVSKVVVMLPSPGKTFTSTVGIDTNGGYTGGSIIFTVNAGAKELYRSKLMQRGDPGVPVNVDLNGATEFVISVEDGGDNINSDQADWADAKVTLSDGKEVWLGDMPFVEVPRVSITADPPFSFNYGDKPSTELLPKWKVTRSSKKLKDSQIEHTVTYSDPATGLVIRNVGIEYTDYPTVEWTIYLKNTGKSDTPIISDLQALDTTLHRGTTAEFTLHHHIGSQCSRDDYRPIDDVLQPGSTKRLTAGGGRSSNANWPYFNIENGGEGVIMAIGWPGEWAADFTRDQGNALHIKAGLDLTHFKLHPGEEVRTPRIVMQFYKGDTVRSQNIWRRWMLAHNLPKPPGGELGPQMAVVNGNQYALWDITEENQRTWLDRYLEEGIKPDYWWIDAGWYEKVGNWTYNPEHFPHGLRPFTDYARSKGLKCIVWYEAEGSWPGWWVQKNHPEWLLGPKGAFQNQIDMGNPDAWKWITDLVDKGIKEHGIDYYRHDHNIDPLSQWRANDAEDRQGITEMKYDMGFLAFYDELRKRHNGMMIDNCASGGRRNDVETLHRSVPLLRSDYIEEPIGQQCHTYGLASWVPFWGTGLVYSQEKDLPYLFRSQMSVHFTSGWDITPKGNYDLHRKLVKQWRELAPNILGDYYPLTPYTQAEDQWIAWQYDRPEKGQGMVQAFRRPRCIYQSAELKLSALEPDASYTVTNIDTGESSTHTGRELMEQGLLISISEKPGAVIFTYSRK